MNISTAMWHPMVRSARGISPPDPLKPHGKRTSTSPSLLPSPLRQVVGTVFSQALPRSPAQRKLRQSWVESLRPLPGEATKVKKTPPKPNDCLSAPHFYCCDSEKEEFLWTIIIPLAPTVESNLFPDFLLYCTTQLFPSLTKTRTLVPCHPETKGSFHETSKHHLLTDIFKKAKQTREVVQVSP